MTERQEREQIRRGLRVLMDDAPLAPEFDGLVDGHLATSKSPSNQRSGWLVAIGAAAAVLLIALVPLLLNSDGHGGTQASQPDKPPTSTAPAAEATTTSPADGSTTLPDGSAQSTGSGAVSPLNSAFVTLEEADAEVWDEMVVQEYVALCMREEGFEYTPYVEEPQEEDSDWNRPVFPVGGDAETERVLVDPNQQYLDSLPESEQRAYVEALTGQDPDVVVEEGAPGGDSDIDATGGSGCDGQSRRRYAAELESAPVPDPDDEVLFAQLDESLNQMIGALEVDETVIGALTDYSACLADAGFAVQYPSSAFDTVYWMPQELYWYLTEQGADLLDALSSNPETGPMDLVGEARVEELSQLEADARDAHATCVGQLEDAVRAFELEYASSDPVLGQYLSEG